MYTHFLFLAALIYSAFSPSAHAHRDIAQAKDVTTVERLRSELLDMRGRPASHPTFRRGSACWWLWLLSGTEVCMNHTPNVPILHR